MCNFISTRNTQWECKAAILVVVWSDDKFARRSMCEYLEWHSTWHVAMIPRRIPQLDLLDCVNVLIAITIVSFEWRQQESFWTTISTARFSDDISLKIELDCVSICVTKFRIHHRCQRLSTRVAKLIIDIVNASIDIMIKVIATWWRIGRWSIRNCCRDMWIELDIENYFGTFFFCFSHLTVDFPGRLLSIIPLWYVLPSKWKKFHWTLNIKLSMKKLTNVGLSIIFLLLLISDDGEYSFSVGDDLNVKFTFSSW